MPTENMTCSIRVSLYILTVAKFPAQIIIHHINALRGVFSPAQELDTFIRAHGDELEIEMRLGKARGMRRLDPPTLEKWD